LVDLGIDDINIKRASLQ